MMAARVTAILAVAGLAACSTPPAVETVSKPKRLTFGKPIYPEDAKQHGRTGRVVADCTITETGSVRNCLIASGAADLAQSALVYLQTSRYAPARRNGVAVASPHYGFDIGFFIDLSPPLVILVRCDVQRSGLVGACRQTASAPSKSWALARVMLEGTMVTPSSLDGHAIDDHERFFRLEFSSVLLPWSGPTPHVDGKVVVSMAFSCAWDRGSTSAVKVMCVSAGQEDQLPRSSEVTRERDFLGITETATATRSASL